MSGFSFGSTATSTAQPAGGFSFGSTATSTAQPSGFSFGSTAASTAQPSTGGFGFGATPATSTASTTGFGFGATQPTGTANTGFGFGTTATSAAPSTGFGGFGSTPAASSASTGFSFGSGNTAAKPAFGGFNTTTSTAGGTGLFGSTAASTFGQPKPAFGAQQPDQQQQQQIPDPTLALHLAICAPNYFNNENDEVLKKWNWVQAMWGTGKGYFAPNVPPVEFTPENPYCRFKVICYSPIPKKRNEDGQVQITFAKGKSEVETHKDNIANQLKTMLGGAEVVIESVEAVTDTKTNVVMYAQQTFPNGDKQKAPAMDAYRYLMGPNHQQSLTNLFVESIIPLVSLTETQLKEYLDTPQRGIDPALWEQGKRENPDPKKFIPVVIIGFQELAKRFNVQIEHAAQLSSAMSETSDGIQELRHKQTMMKANIQNSRWKHAALTRRILKLVSGQEVERKRGVPLDQTEEQIRMRLEDLYMQLTQPTQYRGCLNELMAQMSVAAGSDISGPRYGLVNDVEKDLTQYLKWQQEALGSIVSVLKEDNKTADAMLQEV